MGCGASKSTAVADPGAPAPEDAAAALREDGGAAAGDGAGGGGGPGAGGAGDGDGDGGGEDGGGGDAAAAAVETAGDAPVPPDTPGENDETVGEQQTSDTEREGGEEPPEVEGGSLEQDDDEGGGGDAVEPAGKALLPPLGAERPREDAADDAGSVEPVIVPVEEEAPPAEPLRDDGTEASVLPPVDDHAEQPMSSDSLGGMLTDRDSGSGKKSRRKDRKSKRSKKKKQSTAAAGDDAPEGIKDFDAPAAAGSPGSGVLGDLPPLRGAPKLGALPPLRGQTTGPMATPPRSPPPAARKSPEPAEEERSLAHESSEEERTPVREAPAEPKPAPRPKKKPSVIATKPKSAEVRHNEGLCRSRMLRGLMQILDVPATQINGAMRRGALFVVSDSGKFKEYYMPTANMDNGGSPFHLTMVQAGELFDRVAFDGSGAIIEFVIERNHQDHNLFMYSDFPELGMPLNAQQESALLHTLNLLNDHNLPTLNRFRTKHTFANARVFEILRDRYAKGQVTPKQYSICLKQLTMAAHQWLIASPSPDNFETQELIKLRRHIIPEWV